MSDTSTPLPSLADRVRTVDAGGTVVGVHFLGQTPVFVLGEEVLLFADENDEKRVAVHGGGILASAADDKRVVTGGDDGKLARDRRRWRGQGTRRRRKEALDRPGGAGARGAVAGPSAKTAHVLTGKGDDRTV